MTGLDERSMRLGIGLLCASLGCAAVFTASVHADEVPAPETWAVHGQATFVDLYHPGFRSPYQGANSLDPKSLGDETFDATVFLGVRPWAGGEIWIDPEIDQGFGLSNTLGLAGYASGEAYKVGSATPYFRLQRLFFRQSFDLGGETENVDAGANQLGGTHTADNLVLTGGKISVTDIFDTNTYAHDPKADFLNWSLIDSGAYDYAADAWGYSYGVAAEWTQSWWTLRAGLFDLSQVPNTTALETDFSQFEIVAEAEARHMLWGEPGKLKLLGFVNRGRIGSYNDAVRLGQALSEAPDTALVRRYRSRPGLVINGEQQIDDDWGVFLRASLNDGSQEAYEFTEINRSLALGLSLKGAEWGRKDDTVGFAGVVNGISNAAQSYFAAGGLGILIGDGRLPNYGSEDILETYYSAAVAGGVNVALDYQFVANPAYNRDRGPVSIFGARVHTQF